MLFRLKSLWLTLKFNRKTMILMIIVMVFIAGVTFFSSYLIIFNTVMSNTQEYNRTMIDGMHRGIDSYFKNIESTALSLSFNEFMQNLLASPFRGDDFESLRDREYIQNSLKILFYAEDDLRITVFFEDIDGSVVTSGEYTYSGYDYKQDDWYNEINATEDYKIIYLNDPQNYFVEEERRDVHTFIFKIKSIYNQKVFGYILINIDKSELESFFESDYVDISNTIIVDEDDNIVYNKVESDLFVHSDLNLEGDSGFVLRNVEGEDYIFAYGTSEFTNWKIVNIIPYATLLDDVIPPMQVYIIIPIIIVFATVLIAIFMSRIVTKPIERLKQGVIDVKSGRFGNTIEPVTGDEIGELTEEFNNMTLQIEQLITKNQSSELLIKQSELSALQQQINPHFLYNTLEMIIGMTTENDGEIVIAICKNLGNMFRYNLNGKSIVTLQEELEHIRNYSDIIMQRYYGKFEMQYDFDEDILKHMTAKFTLQPFIENAIGHGFRDITGGGIIRISISREDDCIRINICDNGCGIPPETLKSLQGMLVQYIAQPVKASDIPDYLGIMNVHLRMHMLFEDRYSFEIKSEVGVGTEVIMRIPEM